MHIRTDKDSGGASIGTQVTPFEISPIQKRYLAIKRLAKIQGRPQRFLLLKYRRGGFTTLEQGLSYQYTTSKMNRDVVTIAHTAESTAEIFKIAQLMHGRDPYAPEIKGPGNSRRLDFPTMNSTFRIGTAASGGFGRGFTLQKVHGSEVSQWCKGPKQVENQREMLAALEEATSHGEVVLETTPKGNELFCQLYKEAKRGLNDWTPICLRWFDDRRNRIILDDEEKIREIIETLSDKESDLVTRHGLKSDQIAWRRAATRRLGALFRQEYPEDDESCFLTAGDCFFDSDALMTLLDRTPNEYDRFPLVSARGGSGYKAVWEKPDKDKTYVIGCDTSEGLPGSDPNGLGVLERESGKQVCSIHGRFTPDRLAELCVETAKEYNNALVGVEVEKYGYAVIQRIRRMGWRKPMKHLYYHNPSRAPNAGMGWSTNSKTRPIMLDELAEAVHDGHMVVRDVDFIGECLTFRRQSSGNYAGDSGSYDDNVMKWAIAWQMRKVRRRKPGIVFTDKFRRI